jgi:hypothetical protein
VPLTPKEVTTIMPDVTAATILLNHYTTNVSWVYHIIHTPTAYAQLESVYGSLKESKMPNLSHLALIATLISIGAYFKSGMAQGPSTRQETKASCKKWTIVAQRALQEADYLTSPTVEILQASILMCQFLPNFGQTHMHMSFIGTILNAAHILQLHQLDSLRNRKLRAQGSYNMIDLELKRRIWWHIASTDW